MKKWIFLPVIALASITAIYAQPAKTAQRVGFLDLQKVLDSLPMKDSALSQLKTYNDYFNEDLNSMKKEYDSKLMEYDTYIKGASVDPTIKEMMENTIKTLEENMYNKNQKYQELLQRKQVELVQPIIDSIKSSAKIIAKRNGFTAIVDSSRDLVIFNGNPADDLTRAVIEYMRAEARKSAKPKVPGGK